MEGLLFAPERKAPISLGEEERGAPIPRQRWQRDPEVRQGLGCVRPVSQMGDHRAKERGKMSRDDLRFHRNPGHLEYL